MNLLLAEFGLNTVIIFERKVNSLIGIITQKTSEYEQKR